MVEISDTETSFKKSEKGLIPTDWTIKELGKIAAVTKLAGYEYTKYFNSYKDGGEIIVLRGTNVADNKLDLSNIKTIPRRVSDFLSRSKLNKNDLVFAYVGTIGPVYLVNENDKFHLGPNTSKITVTDSIDPHYLLSYFMSWLVKPEIFEHTSIGAQPSLSMAKIRKFRVVLPPSKEEQIAISKTLNDVEKLIVELDNLIVKKRKILQGALQELLRPKEGWAEKRLGNCLLQNPDYGINAPAVPFSESLPVYLRITDITENGKYSKKNIVSVNNFFSCDYYLAKGDLVFARTGASVGKTYLYDTKDGRLVFAGFLIRVKANPEILLPEYLKYFTQTKIYKDWIQANSMRTGQPGINGNEYQELRLSFPPTIGEQQRIAKVLADMEAEIEMFENKFDKYKMIKQGMMQNLLTGKIRLI